MDEYRKISKGSQEESSRRQKGNIGDLQIEYGHGISNEDKLLAAKDKNAVDFVQNYSKLWCKCLKDLIFSLEKRAMYENECMRVNVKLFQGLENSILSTTGAPLMDETLRFSQMMVAHAKEIELHNTKRCRELIEVMNRQRTEFAKTRKFLKNKWKADVKRMVDAESALFKAKSTYFNRCQAGVKLREELASAQASLDESQAALLVAATAPPTLNTLATNQQQQGGGGVGGDTQQLSANGSFPDSAGSTDQGFPPPVDQALMNTVMKQKAKVERLEKQLVENDKKEMETMYIYRESVDAANTKLIDLEKSKVEIICDTRLTVTKCDEVVSDSMAEIISHLFVTRTTMLGNYEDIATRFQNYMPGAPYHDLLQKHADNGSDVLLDKYQFEGYHDNPANAKDRGDASFGKFVSSFAHVYSKDNTEAGDGRHSESDSDGEDVSTAGGTKMFSSLVQFGSNLFRPDLKKASIRSKVRGGAVGSAGATELDPAVLLAMEAAAEREYDNACFVLIQCITGLEKRKDGILTEGIYRVPASKVKMVAVLESIRIAKDAGFKPVDLSEEYPITLASSIKTRLIELPEPLLSYNLYDQFVAIGKALDGATSATIDEQLKKLNALIGQLSEANRQVAGLLFHHLKRVSDHETSNQMGPANLATMFGPTLLRQKPKFNVANMMELVDNTWLKKVVELCIDRAADVFGEVEEYAMPKLLKIIQQRAIDQEQADEVIVNPTPAVLSAPVSSVVPPREAFFHGMSGDSASAISLSPKPVMSHSERHSPNNSRGKSVGSSVSDDSAKVQSCLPSSPKEVLLPQTKSSSQDSSTESSKGSGVSNLRRMISAKAQSVHQRVQQITSESGGKIVQNTRKLLYAASVRNSPNQKSRKDVSTDNENKDVSKGLDVAECSYIDTDSDS